MQNFTQRGNRSRGRRSKVAGVAIALLVALYALVAPKLNQRYDWSLPGLDQVADRSGEEISTPEVRQRDTSRPSSSIEAPTSSAEAASFETSGDREMDEARRWLRETSTDLFLSPAGLLYGPGSAEGHRLDHVRRHAEDMPDRPGPHGVFDGPFINALKVIDEAWKLAGQQRQTTKRVDGRRTIYQVDLMRRVGFVGGRTGASRGHPEATRVQLVLEGNRVITAYPLEPAR